jgi:hypothetical protein
MYANISNIYTFIFMRTIAQGLQQSLGAMIMEGRYKHDLK